MTVSPSPAIAVDSVGKKYCPDLRRALRYGAGDIFREMTLRGTPSSSLRPGEFWALDDVSFEVAQGEALGVVGRNGAGKSTLLRMLAGVTKPDRGEIRIAGRVGSLLSLGAGFDATLTGRENILIEGAALGIGRARLGEVTERIVDFAELDGFIDAPVHTYSDGMRMRLGFAVATSLRTDILLLDEVLIVGDINFRRKSVEHIKHFVGQGGSIVFVSHEMWLIQAMCTEVIHLSGGRVVAHGEVMATINHYYEELGAADQQSGEDPPEPSAADVADEDDERDPSEATAEDAPPSDATVSGGASAPTGDGEAAEGEDQPVVVGAVSIRGPDDGPVTTGRPAHVRAEVEVTAPELEVFWGFAVWTPDRMACITTQGTDKDVPPLTLARGHHVLRVTIRHVPLMAGTFLLGVAVIDEATRMPLALHGWDDHGTLFAIETPVTEKATMQKTGGAMMDVDVEWVEPASV